MKTTTVFEIRQTPKEAAYTIMAYNAFIFLLFALIYFFFWRKKIKANSLENLD